MSEPYQSTLPGGFWRTISAASEQPPTTTTHRLWPAVRQQVAAPRPPAAIGIWQLLAQRTDLASYCPCALSGVVEEVVNEGEQSYAVLRSPEGNYLRLTAAERELWHLMDGTQSVARLATMGFLRFKQLLPVADLVQNLKRQGFLNDRSILIYRQLEQSHDQHEATGWGKRLLKIVQGYTLTLTGLDAPLGAFYRAVGWLAFTRPALVLHTLISVIGLIAFLLAMGQPSPTYQLFNSDGVVSSLLALWVALFVSFILHELAHALAVKHFGRHVYRGGVMLYYGMPAAFVDTSDIWLAGRWARIAVSLAGPLADMLIGGVAALYAFAFPDGFLSSAAYRLAFACYSATLFNLNPLLELDGYYVLGDLLRLPNLRKRALAFVAGPLWGKLRNRVRLSREERIFSLYGMLSAIYTLLAIILAILFWQRQILSIFADLWNNGWGGRIVALLLTVGVILPVGVGFLMAGWGLVRTAAAWVFRHGYARSVPLVALILTGFVSELSLLPLAIGYHGSVSLVVPLLWSTGLAALILVRPDYAGAGLARAMSGLILISVLLIAASLGLVLLPLGALLWVGLEVVAFVILMLSSFDTLLDTDLRMANQAELVLTVLLMIAAFWWGGLGILRVGTATGAIFAAAPVYLGAMALALQLPHLLGQRDSRLGWSWLLLWGAIAVHTGTYAFELEIALRSTALAQALELLASGLWAAAWAIHYVTLRSPSPRTLTWPSAPAMSESQRLQRAFQLAYAGCYRLLREIYGSRRAQALDDRMDVLAATASWDVTLDREQVRISPTLASQPLDIQGTRYAEALRYTVATIETICGASFARRAIQAAYDALPWPEREAADRRCFPNTPWARELSHAFGSERQARLRLLRQVALFTTCDDDELAAIAGAMHPLQVAAGQRVWVTSAASQGIWIVEAGEIVAWEDRQAVDELHRGEHFGATNPSGPTANTQPVERVYRATIESSLLFLPLSEFTRLTESENSHATEGFEVVEALRLLERVPLFTEVPRHTLRGLARLIERRTLVPKHVIVRQGQPSGTFYLIKEGRAAIIVRNSPEEAARVVAQLGPEEFFGEIELLRGTPPVASVVAITPMQVLALPHTAISSLLLGSTNASRSLEQVGTGRMRDLGVT